MAEPEKDRIARQTADLKVTFDMALSNKRKYPVIVVSHLSTAALLQRQAGLGAVQRLNLTLLVDASS